MRLWSCKVAEVLGECEGVTPENIVHKLAEYAIHIAGLDTIDTVVGIAIVAPPTTLCGLLTVTSSNGYKIKYWDASAVGIQEPHRRNLYNLCLKPSRTSALCLNSYQSLERSVIPRPATPVTPPPGNAPFKSLQVARLAGQPSRGIMSFR
jgi:hypothetical protein